MQSKALRGKIRLTSYLLFIFLANDIFNNLFVSVSEFQGFIAGCKSADSAFFQSTEFSHGIGDILMIILCCFFWFVLARVFYAFFDKETPFLPKLPKQMKLSAVLLVASYAVPYAVMFIIYKIQQAKFGAELVANPITVEEISLLSSSTFVALIILCLAYVFEYGMALQRECDELL